MNEEKEPMQNEPASQRQREKNAPASIVMTCMPKSMCAVWMCVLKQVSFAFGLPSADGIGTESLHRRFQMTQ